MIINGENIILNNVRHIIKFSMTLKIKIILIQLNYPSIDFLLFIIKYKYISFLEYIFFNQKFMNIKLYNRKRP